jgi:hypothetical protein
MITQRLTEQVRLYSRSWLSEAHVIALQRLLHKRMLLKSKHST